MLPALTRRVHRVVTRFAAVVCPPEVAQPGRMEATLDEFWRMLDALGPPARRLLRVLFLVFDQGARLYPACHGRSFAAARPAAACRYVAAVLGRSELAERLKGLVVMCYYEQPEVQREIGYLPEPYIAAVTRRRLARYGAEISRAREP